MSIETKFARIGARARWHVAEPARQWDFRLRRWTVSAVRPVAIDVVRDRRGEFFDIAVRRDVKVEALDVDALDRHLLLLARVGEEKPRYLCGRDERHWFVAAIPEVTPVSTVEDAKLALRPRAVVRGAAASRKRLLARRTAEFVRQGEWFFVPMPEFRPRENDPLRRNEPMSRGSGSTPHVAAESIRIGGVAVWFPQIAFRPDSRHVRGYSDAEMERLAKAHPGWTWRSMLRDPELYVRGSVRHPDHATIALRGWHRVFMNTESQARAAAHVVFLD